MAAREQRGIPFVLRADYRGAGSGLLWLLASSAAAAFVRRGTVF